MDIRISGHQVETGDALGTHVTDRLQGIAEKHFARTISSEVTFGKGPHNGFKCDIVMHVTRGLVLKGRHDAQDAHLAFDGAATRIEKQPRQRLDLEFAYTGGSRATTRAILAALLILVCLMDAVSIAMVTVFGGILGRMPIVCGLIMLAISASRSKPINKLFIAISRRSRKPVTE